MGCVQSTENSRSPGRGVERRKLENGYTKGEAIGGDLSKSLRGSVEAKSAANGSDGRGRGVDKKITRESVRGVGGGNVAQRIPVKKIDADGLVGGWPKWLIENVPEDILAGFVPKSADSYEKLAKVGKGTYSNVYKAQDKSTGKIVALKKVRFDTSESASVKFMAREIITLRRLDHPNIIKLEGIATSRMQCSLYLVLDFMPFDMTKVISRPDGRLTEPQVKSYMQQLLAGLKHCHDMGILHRDIKGSNLLIDEKGVLKIADFGLANFYKNKPKRPLTSRVVTLWYRAPELLLGSTDYGVGVDLWSVGCLLAEMFLGRPIMPGTNEIEQLHKIFKLCGSPSEDYWKTLKPPATFRPPQQYKTNFREAFPYFPMTTLSLLGKLLALDPASRGTAASALQSEFFTTSPLPSDLSSLPAIRIDEDKPVPTLERKGIFNLKQQSQKIWGTHRRKVSFTDLIQDVAQGKQKELHMASNVISQEAGIGSTSDSKPMDNQDIPPRSPTPAFLSQHNRSAITEAHPNALKNIKNYPLLLASLTETAQHLRESKSSLYHRSISYIDYRTLDLEEISKLFGKEDPRD